MHTTYYCKKVRRVVYHVFMSGFLIAAYCPSGCHAILLLHQDSQIYDKMTRPSLKENIIDKN